MGYDGIKTEKLNLTFSFDIKKPFYRIYIFGINQDFFFFFKKKNKKLLRRFISPRITFRVNSLQGLYSLLNDSLDESTNYLTACPITYAVQNKNEKTVISFNQNIHLTPCVF